MNLEGTGVSGGHLCLFSPHFVSASYGLSRLLCNKRRKQILFFMERDDVDVNYPCQFSFGRLYLGLQVKCHVCV